LIRVRTIVGKRRVANTSLARAHPDTRDHDDDGKAPWQEEYDECGESKGKRRWRPQYAYVRLSASDAGLTRVGLIGAMGVNRACGSRSCDAQNQG
jgi:hypothetical protein